ncbi:MAG: ABC transporter permease [Lachnospiraceae bacterium]|nr:ABC transporter permease [Lachnospiraceae bacterium]
MSEEQKQYLDRILRYQKGIRFFRLLLLIGFLVFWEAAARMELINVFFFSSPCRMLKTFVSLLNSGSLLMHIGCTLAETLISFTLVTVLSLLIAIWLWYCRTASDVSEPFWVILNSLPKSALAPLLIVWLGTGMKTIIIAGMSVAIFGSIINIYTGLKQVDEDMVKLIYTLNGTKRDVLMKVVLPKNIPNVISNMKVNIGLSLVGVIIGEFLAARRGLGYLIIYGSQVFKLDMVLMSIMLLSLIAILLYGIIHLLEKKYTY